MDSTTACQQSEQILITMYNEAAKSHFLSHTYIYTYTHPDTHTVTLYNKWEVKTEKEKKGLYKKICRKRVLCMMAVPFHLHWLHLHHLGQPSAFVPVASCS